MLAIVFRLSSLLHVEENRYSDIIIYLVKLPYEYTYFCVTLGAESLFAHFTGMSSIEKAKFGLHTMEADLKRKEEKLSGNIQYIS